jgi:NADH-quinone oxidoreductase subunit A
MLISAYSYVALFFVASIVFVLAAFITSWCLRPHKPTPAKLSTYECGEPSLGTGFIQYNVRYYLIALLFVIFDVEVVFLLPWAVVFRELGMFGFVEAVIFILILLVGLIYAWKNRILEWL